MAADESGAVASYLSAPVLPGAGFADSLEARLMTEPVLATGSVVAREARRKALRPRFLKLALPGGSIAAAALAVALFITLQGGESTPPLYADVIRDSAARLYDLETVRYSVSVESEQQVCITVIATSSTREFEGSNYYDWSQSRAIPEEQRTTYGCVGGVAGKHVEERGVYDLVSHAFLAESRGTGKTLFPSDDLDTFTSERMYVDGVFYARQAGGAWNRIPTDAPWIPFAFGGQGDGQVPVGDVEHLMATYENIEIVATEQTGGEIVTHYRATRDFLVGEETIDAWIGLSDGLPRKATIVMVAKEHERLLWYGFPRSEGSRLTMGGLLLSPDSIIPEAEAGSVLYTYTYEFGDFNEPVSIVAP